MKAPLEKFETAVLIIARNVRFCHSAAADQGPSIAVKALSKTMTDKAKDTPYAEFIKAGWMDAELVSNGYMTA
jgi:hypothetical protein